MTKSSILSFLIAAAALAVPAAQQIKPFDQKAENSATLKEIDSQFQALQKAIYDQDGPTAGLYINENFTLLVSLGDTIEEGDSYDAEEYLDSVDAAEAIGAYHKDNFPDDAEVESKITQFMGGRRISMAQFTETLKCNIIDEDGEYGEKGATCKMEVTTVGYDEWFSALNEEDVKTWLLYDREITSLVLKINGKVVDLNDGEGKTAKL